MPFLDPATCAQLLGALPPDGWQDGRIARPSRSPARAETIGEPVNIADDTVRSCRINDRLDPAFVARLQSDAMTLGAAVFQFDIDGFHDDDPPHVMRYEAGDGFAWHVDNGTDTAPIASRKLAFSIQLSDPATYVGGDLQLALYDQKYLGTDPGMAAAMRAQGSLILFAAFQLHRIAPVTSGRRDALVGWLHGPAFR